MRTSEIVKNTRSDLQWVSDHELVLPVLPQGEKAMMLERDQRIAEITKEEWEKLGEVVKPLLVPSKVASRPQMQGRPQSEMLLIDVDTGEERVIAAAPDFETLRMSPDRRFLAFLKQVGVWHPEPDQAPIKHLRQEIYQLEIIEVRDHFRPTTMTGLREVFLGSTAWSPDGTE